MSTTNDHSEISIEEINEMEQRRVEALDAAGVDEKKVLSQAHEQITLWTAYFNENEKRGKDDMSFVLRDQWSNIEANEFTRLFKVKMQFNKLLDPVNKIVGEQRNNKPDLMVRSLTGHATQEAVDLRADLVRTIAYRNQNDLVYQQAFKSALLLGWGAFQVDVDYEHPTSFNKVIDYHLIPDPTKCTWDPSAIKPHKGDGNFCSRQYLFTKKEFAAAYPYITNPVSYVDPRTFLDYQWQTKDTIIICDYFVKEWFTSKILLLSDGRSVTEDEWEEIKKTEIKLKKELAKDTVVVKDAILDTIPEVTAERYTEDYKIMRYRLIKDQIIEFSEWPSKYLPIIFVDGNSHFVEGRQYTKSFVHEAKDAQKFVNFVGSEIATEIKNRRREQWIGTPDNIIGFEQEWRHPEVQVAMLKAKPDPVTGQLPQKLPPWNMSPELLQEFQRGSQDIREILGFSESQALQGRDISGKARRERKMEGSMATYVFMDNLNQAIEQGGRVCLDLLPYIFDRDDRHMVITKKDGRTDSILINKANPDGSKTNMIEGGDYDIEIDTGPSFAVQKEMALEFFQQTIAANPQTFPLIADLWAKNLDVQHMQQIADRFKTMVPPQILAEEEGVELPPQPPSPQEQMMQLEMQTRQQEMAAKQQELNLKMEKLELEKQKLALDAEKAKINAQLDVFNHQANIQKSAVVHGLENKKAEMDYTAKMAKIIAEIEKMQKETGAL